MADAEQPFSVMKIDFVPHSDWIRRGPVHARRVEDVP